MTAPIGDRPGEREAVEAVAKWLSCYDTVMNVAAESRSAVAAAYPLIAAAVRDGTLREVEAVIAGLASYNCELRYDGTEDPEIGAWVQGIHNAHDAVADLRSAAPEPTP